MAGMKAKLRGNVAATVESGANPAVKELRRVLRQGGLFADRYWVAESPKLLEEALRSGLSVPLAYVDAKRQERWMEMFAGRFGGEWIPLGERALASLATVETSQGLLALVEKPRVAPEELFGGNGVVLVLDRIQDPGNAGMMLRSAEAFGASGCILLAGSVSGDSPKVLRASAGSRFRMRVLEGLEAGPFLEMARAHQVTLYAAEPTARRSLGETKWRFPAALIVGNEGAGVDGALLQRAEGFRIPTQGVESLNAGVSAAIALYEMGKGRTSAQNGGMP
jgi:TrmH family RNA methyltransferase